MEPTKKHLARRNSSFRFKCGGMESWFYLCEGRGVNGCSFHQVNAGGQHDVHGLNVKRLIKALVACGYIDKPKEHP